MSMTGAEGPAYGGGFNPYAVGKKRYRGGTTFSPTMGQVDKSGYQDREMRNNAKREAYLRWLRDQQRGALGSANSLRLMGR